MPKANPRLPPTNIPPNLVERANFLYPEFMSSRFRNAETQAARACLDAILWIECQCSVTPSSLKGATRPSSRESLCAALLQHVPDKYFPLGAGVEKAAVIQYHESTRQQLCLAAAVVYLETGIGNRQPLPPAIVQSPPMQQPVMLAQSVYPELSFEPSMSGVIDPGLLSCAPSHEHTFAAVSQEMYEPNSRSTTGEVPYPLNPAYRNAETQTDLCSGLQPLPPPRRVLKAKETNVHSSASSQTAYATAALFPTNAWSAVNQNQMMFHTQFQYPVVRQSFSETQGVDPNPFQQTSAAPFLTMWSGGKQPISSSATREAHMEEESIDGNAHASESEYGEDIPYDYSPPGWDASTVQHQEKRKWEED